MTSVIQTQAYIAYSKLNAFDVQKVTYTICKASIYRSGNELLKQLYYVSSILHPPSASSNHFHHGQRNYSNTSTSFFGNDYVTSCSKLIELIFRHLLCNTTVNQNSLYVIQHSFYVVQHSFYVIGLQHSFATLRCSKRVPCTYKYSCGFLELA